LSKARYVITSDWHVLESNLRECERVTQELHQFCKRNSVGMVLHLGDIKSTLNPVDQNVTNFLVRSIKTFLEDGIEFAIVLGNHDKIGISDNTGSCFPVLEAIGARAIEDLASFVYSGQEFVVVPWRRSLKEQSDMLSGLEPNPDAVLLLHGMVRGCKMSQYRVAPKGLSIDFGQWKYAFAGHVHKHQKLGRNAWYVGSPFAHDWGEVNQPKGFMAVLGNNKPKFVPLHVRLYYDPNAPEFKRPTSNQGVHVRVNMGTNGNVGNVERVIENARRRYNAEYVSIVYSRPEKHQTLEQQELDPVSELVEKYVERNPPPNDPDRCAVPILLSLLKRPTIGRQQTQSLKFIQASASNFLCFKNLSLQFDPGLTLITGENKDWGGCSNGSGKSSALSIASVALFGRTPKGQTHNAWARNRRTYARVQMEFEVAGTRYRVTRTRNTPSLELHQEKNDGTWANLTSSSLETQRTIERITGLSWDVFTSSCYIGQSELVRVLIGTDKDRKELFAKILDLGDYELARKRALDLQRNAQQEEQSRRMIASSTSVLLDNVERTLAAVKVPDWDPSEYQRTKQKARKVDKQLDQKEQQYRKAQLRSRELEEKRDSIRDQLNDLEVASRVLEKEIQRLKGLGGGKCPTCGQPVPKSHLDSKLKPLLEKQKRLANDTAATNSAMDKVQAEIDKLEARMETLEEQVRKLRRDSMVTNHKVLDLETEKTRYEEASEQAADLKAQRDELKRQLEAHRVAADEMKWYSDLMEYCKTALGRKGIPSVVCARLIPKLNAAAEEYSQLLSDGTISVTFVASEDGAINVEIGNLHGGEDISDQSNGESRTASLITALALRQSALTSNILVLDEPGEGLDSKNAKRFGEVLGQIASKFGSVWVTTHNPFILSALDPDRHIHIVKQDGMATAQEV